MLLFDHHFIVFCFVFVLEEFSLSGNQSRCIKRYGAPVENIHTYGFVNLPLAVTRYTRAEEEKEEFEYSKKYDKNTRDT